MTRRQPPRGEAASSSDRLCLGHQSQVRGEAASSSHRLCLGHESQVRGRRETQQAMRSTRAASKPPPTRKRAGSRAGDNVPSALAERLLTIGEVAYNLRVSRNTIYAMIRRGDLPALRVSWMLRVRLRDVNAYVRLHGPRLRRPRGRSP